MSDPPLSDIDFTNKMAWSEPPLKIDLERQHYRVTLTVAKLLLILSTLHMKILQSSEIRPRKEIPSYEINRIERFSC